MGINHHKGFCHSADRPSSSKAPQQLGALTARQDEGTSHPSGLTSAKLLVGEGKNVYFTVPIYAPHQQYLRFSVQGLNTNSHAALWPGMRSMGIHKTFKASDGLPETQGKSNAHHNIHRRHAGDRQQSPPSEGAPSGPSICPGKLGFCAKLEKVSHNPNTVSGLAHKLHGHAGRPAARGKDQTDSNDILKAADWNSESVFRKFYYHPVFDPSYGQAVLSLRHDSEGEDGNPGE